MAETSISVTVRCETHQVHDALAILTRAKGRRRLLPVNVRRELDAVLADADVRGGWDKWFSATAAITKTIPGGPMATVDVEPSPRLAALLGNLQIHLRDA